MFFFFMRLNHCSSGSNICYVKYPLSNIYKVKDSSKGVPNTVISPNHYSEKIYNVNFCAKGKLDFPITGQTIFSIFSIRNNSKPL